MSVYVEILIPASLELLWKHTQQPELHERWDLRFSRIEYLPNPGPNGELLFRYATRLGFGREITGTGQSLGERVLPGGNRASALKFGSADRLSLIREGSGYWKYIPVDDGVKFLTVYDYTTRFGRVGKAFDSLIFRPLMGWATAWSFDRLRIWLERGIPPNVALRNSVVHTVARVTLAFVFFYQGIVPKLITQHNDELILLRALGVRAERVALALGAAGVLEVLLACCVIAFWWSKWPLILTLVLMVVATVVISFVAPAYLTAAFNPVALNAAVAATAIVDLLTDPKDVPSASRCSRQPPAKHS